MRILAVNKTDTMNAYWYGGAEIRALNILRRWACFGHEIVQLSSRFPGAPRYQKICGIHVYRYGPAIYRNEIAPFTLDMGLVKHLIRINPDVVYLASPPFPVVVPRLHSFFKSIAKWRRAKVVAHIDHLPTLESSSSSTRYLLYKLNEQLTKTVPCDVVTTVSKSTCKKLQQFFRSKIIVTGNGVDTNIFKPLDMSIIPNSIFSWGVLYKRKNFQSVIKALKIVKREIPEAKMRLAGEGPEKKKLFLLAKQLGLLDSVSFLGRISTGRLVKEINRAEVIVIPSLLEGFGVPVVEAMACKKTIIASNIEALNELIDNGKNGILVLPKDIHAIARAIIRVFDEKEFATRLAREGFSFSQSFSWDEVARKELEVVMN